jgi:hypothetical protein
MTLQSFKKHIYLSVTFVVFSLLFVIVAGHSNPVHAQEAGAFNIVTSPLPISISGKPGSTLSADIRIKNGGSTTEKLKVTLMKFSAYGDEGKPAIADREPGDDYFDWVTFSPSLFDAEPNEWKTIKMTIKLPQTAAFGYYYAAAFSRANEVKPNGKQNVLLGSTAVLVLVDAKVPNAKRSAEILSFTTNKKAYEFLPVSFGIKVRNNGNVHLVPTGNIIISRGNKEVARLSVNSASGNVLPTSNRIFNVDWGDGFPNYAARTVAGKTVLDKNGKTQTQLQWDINKISHLRFGRYTAHLIMVYDDGTKDVPLEATISFWVIPWRLLALLLIILLIPAVIVFLVMQRRIKRLKNVKYKL